MKLTWRYVLSGQDVSQVYREKFLVLWMTPTASREKLDHVTFQIGVITDSPEVTETNDFIMNK